MLYRFISGNLYSEAKGPCSQFYSINIFFNYAIFVSVNACIFVFAMAMFKNSFYFSITLSCLYSVSELGHDRGRLRQIL